MDRTESSHLRKDRIEAPRRKEILILFCKEDGMTTTSEEWEWEAYDNEVGTKIMSL